MMRPDRFKAVFCLTVPYVPRGDVSDVRFVADLIPERAAEMAATPLGYVHRNKLR